MNWLLAHHINRDTVTAFAAGMFFCAALFNYVFWLHKRKEEAMEFIRRRFEYR